MGRLDMSKSDKLYKVAKVILIMMVGVVIGVTMTYESSNLEDGFSISDDDRIIAAKYSSGDVGVLELVNGVENYVVCTKNEDYSSDIDDVGAYKCEILDRTHPMIRGDESE